MFSSPKAPLRNQFYEFKPSLVAHRASGIGHRALGTGHRPSDLVVDQGGDGDQPWDQKQNKFRQHCNTFIVEVQMAVSIMFFCYTTPKDPTYKGGGVKPYVFTGNMNRIAHSLINALTLPFSFASPPPHGRLARRARHVSCLWLFCFRSQTQRCR